MIRLACLCLCCLIAGSSASWAQESHLDAPGEIPKYVKDPIPLYTTGLGPFHRPITTKNKEAQAFFDQGFQMMYAFARLDAVRSFREAWKRDPECAICYWGEGWAWGSYLNGPMSAEQSPFAYAATQKAISLKDKASPKERDFIDALSVRYVKDFDVKKRREQDEAYAEAMAKVAAKHPADLDAITLYADALFLLEPRRGTRDVNAPNIKKLHGVLESALKIDPKHPGACHLYVHATESTVRPDLAENCAQYLGKTIPGASHINHMPSHTWNEVGRWGDSVEANTQAWHSDLKADAGEGFAIYPDHNLHMLLYAASMDGQGARAIQAGKDYGKRTSDSMYHALTLIRFGRFDEVVELTKRPGARDSRRGVRFLDGLRQAEAGRAGIRQGLPRQGQESRRNLEAAVPHPSRGEDRRRARQHPRRRNRAAPRATRAAAIEKFERAVKLDDEMEYDEPEPLPFPARHWLGAALIQAKRFADAEKIYREDIKDHPHNGWSLLGLQQALKGQGKTDPDVDADLAKSWSRSDTWIRASRF